MSNPEIVEDDYGSNGTIQEGNVDKATPSANATTSTNAALESSNGHAATSKLGEEVADIMYEEDGVDDDAVENETPDEEENLFMSLEEQEKADAEAAALNQPKAVEAAPRLLQAALKEGQVKADESEEESDKEAASEQKQPVSPEPHIHKRVRLILPNS
jgi:hypothetical protein